MAGTNVSTPTSRGFADEIAMHALAMLPGPYLPWSAGTMRPAGLVTVCNDIVLNGVVSICIVGEATQAAHM